MPCPRCDRWMIQLEFRGVQVDYCEGCGIWLDAGELESLAGSPSPANVFETVGLPRKPLICPRCESRMVEAKVTGTDVVVDRCPHGDGTWFDRSELERTLRALRTKYGELPGVAPLEGFLASVFPAGNSGR